MPPMAIEDCGETNPHAGVIATRPMTMATQHPTKVAFPVCKYSMTIQTATATHVERCELMKAVAACLVAPQADPALKANVQPYQRSEVPTRSFVTSTLTSFLTRRSPTMSDAARAAAAAAMWIGVPPAKSTT